MPGLLGLLDWLYPPKCALCDRIGRPAVCSDCRGEMMPLPGGLAPADGDLEWSLSLYAYSGRAAQAVRRLKFDRATSLADPMAREMADALRRLPDVDGAVPVPIHWRRRFHRGFNQAELLVGAMPPGLVRPQWLARLRHTRPQVELTAAERAVNLIDAFRASPSVVGLRVLLVDDVLTTGATARECAKALRKAGSAWVGLLTFCGPTPPSRLEEGDPEPAHGED